MEKISCHDKLTTEEFLRRVNEDRQILNSVWQRKHRWIGHVLRQDGLLHEIIEGRMNILLLLLLLIIMSVYSWQSYFIDLIDNWSQTTFLDMAVDVRLNTLSHLLFVWCVFPWIRSGILYISIGTKVFVRYKVMVVACWSELSWRLDALPVVKSTMSKTEGALRVH